MTTSPDLAPDLLAFAREQRRIADRAEADLFMAAATWADEHSVDSVAPARSDWDEKAMPLAGEGTPEVAEFCVAELAAVLGMTTHAGRALIGDALETRHRLPKVWARVVSGSLQVWRARQVAHLTYGLSPEGAAYVDDHVAAFAHRIGYAALQRLLEEARIRFVEGYEPEGGPIRPDGRKVRVGLGQISTNGTADLWGELDYADASDLERAIARRATVLGADGGAGAGLPLDARRALALGEMARHDLCLDLATGERSPRAGGGVELKVHVDARDLAADRGGLARVEGTGGNGAFITLDALRAWLQRPGVRISVRTVIDTTDTIRVDQWEIPDRLRRHVTERDGTCRFPWCSHPGHQADIDHVAPYDDAGPPGQTSTDNLTPCCRQHHRLKTHAGWSYTMLDPGYYLWRSPTGHRFLVTPRGTQTL
ncbi:HNH endonuclease signature motif containing protein [Nocardioides jiangxiensis]|uniref:DUF222 domain-containing protein n=1 Tax=Nocardioides jiangxiensis TaxID=3064524 RepID=A0ABT9B7K7_9ACTN|nr:HNH endonuclease signature motif containing protein [Nocardioides sp. WY-20]MDO7869567.1 DUF222 domain-containing protein [Nocardioides sp. WY-20]